MGSSATALMNNLNVDNFFVVMAATQGYRDTKENLSKGVDCGSKKVYNNMKKMLRESYFVGSLKYGNNFMV